MSQMANHAYTNLPVCVSCHVPRYEMAWDVEGVGVPFEFQNAAWYPFFSYTKKTTFGEADSHTTGSVLPYNKNARKIVLYVL